MKYEIYLYFQALARKSFFLHFTSNFYEIGSVYSVLLYIHFKFVLKTPYLSPINIKNFQDIFYLLYRPRICGGKVGLVFKKQLQMRNQYVQKFFEVLIQSRLV